MQGRQTIKLGSRVNFQGLKSNIQCGPLFTIDLDLFCIAWSKIPFQNEAEIKHKAIRGEFRGETEVHDLKLSFETGGKKIICKVGQTIKLGSRVNFQNLKSNIQCGPCLHVILIFSAQHGPNPFAKRGRNKTQSNLFQLFLFFSCCDYCMKHPTLFNIVIYQQANHQSLIRIYSL